MQTRDVGIICSLLAGFINDLVHSTCFILDDLLDVCGMDPSIEDQFGEGTTTDLASDGVEAGYSYRIGSIVHDYVDTCGLLKGFDVASVASDDASLHLFVGEGDY